MDPAENLRNATGRQLLAAVAACVAASLLGSYTSFRLYEGYLVGALYVVLVGRGLFRLARRNAPKYLLPTIPLWALVSAFVFIPLFIVRALAGVPGGQRIAEAFPPSWTEPDRGSGWGATPLIALLGWVVTLGAVILVIPPSDRILALFILHVVLRGSTLFVVSMPRPQDLAGLPAEAYSGRIWLLALWNEGPLPRRYRWPIAAIEFILLLLVLQNGGWPGIAIGALHGGAWMVFRMQDQRRQRNEAL